MTAELDRGSKLKAEARAKPQPTLVLHGIISARTDTAFQQGGNKISEYQQNEKNN